jgi:dTDP-4-amino-4,6-dideoxygalactose transaminase
VIPYGKQSIEKKDLDEIAKVLESDWLTMGPVGDVFATNLQALTTVKHAIPVSSGTAALHVAYEILNFEPGSEVIMSPLTFVSTAATAIKAGLKVVFADIQSDTGNLDPFKVESLITEKTRAITVVDFAGHPSDMDEFRSLANQHNLVLICDAAHSFNSLYKGQPVGTIADITCFSFFPTKNFTTGEGGALVTNSNALAQKAKLYKSQGMVREKEDLQLKDEGPWHQEVHDLGLNYRLSDILSALGISQLQRIQEFKEKRRNIFDRYIEELKDLNGLLLPAKRDYVDPMWHLFPIRVSAVLRREMYSFLRNSGIGVQVNYLPVYLHPYFTGKGYKKGLCPIAEEYYAKEISLPMHSELSFEEQSLVIAKIKEFLSTK